MGDALLDVALFQFAQIEAGGKMLALAGEQHGADAVGQRREEGLDAEDGLVIQRVALLRALEPQDGDVALPLGGERSRQRHVEPVGRHHSTSYTSSRTLRASRCPRASARMRLSQSTAGSDGLEPHHGAEIIERGIDAVAPRQPLQHRRRTMPQAVAGDQDARAAIGLDGVARLDVGGAVAAHDLPIGAARQDAAVELRAPHGAAGNVDDAPLAIGRAAQIHDGREFGVDGEDRFCAQHGGHLLEPKLDPISPFDPVRGGP